MRERTGREIISRRNDFCFSDLFEQGGVCVCVTIEKKSHTWQSLYRSDEQLHQRLPTALWLGLVDLQNDGVNETATVTT